MPPKHPNGCGKFRGIIFRSPRNDDDQTISAPTPCSASRSATAATAPATKSARTASTSRYTVPATTAAPSGYRQWNTTGSKDYRALITRIISSRATGNHHAVAAGISDRATCLISRGRTTATGTAKGKNTRTMNGYRWSVRI
jgi:hypothetical protein